MDRCREAFEQYIRSQSGFTADFKIGCNGQYRSDLMHFMFITWQYQQKQIDELQARVDAATNVYEKYRNGCCDIYDVFDEVEQALKGGEV
ncbi:hypothetical protein [Acinetobacter soli]|uniref:hypothetical protein n=1 Tax=Acinetobacter soli TaxID=487316 RepID=UPI001D09E83A|nr:hypothetical protein [Acinetobacter soli]MCB8769534.1 hypothetical protein [Acinetobacter soli]